MHTVSQPSVSQLLVATCQHKARRKCRLWNEAVQQAAKKAVSECDVLDVLIDGYDRWLSVEVNRDGDSESFEAREAHELHEEDEPTKEQYQQATKQAEHNWQVIRQVAEGEPLLIRWVNGEVDTSEMNRREWTPINARFTNPMLDEWRRSDDGDTTIAPQPWDIVTASVINESQVSGLSKPVLAVYADQFHFSDMPQSTRVSVELARLNSTDLNQHILQRLNAEFGADSVADLIGKIYPTLVNDDDGDVESQVDPPAATPLSHNATEAGNAGKKERFVFALEGDVFRIEGFAKRGHFKRSVGLQRIWRLLQTPGKAVGMVELSGANGSTQIAADAQSRQPVMDAKGKKNARVAIEKLRRERDEAISSGNNAEVERCDTDIEKIISELTRATGIGGKDRDLDTVLERQRTKIRQSISDACEKLAAAAPPMTDLAKHFNRNIAPDGSGTGYIYQPGRDFPQWILDVASLSGEI